MLYIIFLLDKLQFCILFQKNITRMVQKNVQRVKASLVSCILNTCRQVLAYESEVLVEGQFY